MSNELRRAASRVRQGPFVVPIYIVFVVGAIVAMILSYEDYITSYRGYISIPTNKATSVAPYAAALLPQLLQVVFMYTYFGTDSGKRWMPLVALCAHFADVYSDMVYKVGEGGGLSLWITAFVESEIAYTLGSEVLLITCAGMLFYLTPDFVAQVMEIVDAFGDEGGSKDGIEHRKDMRYR